MESYYIPATDDYPFATLGVACASCFEVQNNFPEITKQIEEWKNNI